MMIKVLDKGYIELIDSMGDDATVVASARVSYIGESKGKKADDALIQYLMKNGHTSPFEHVVFTFRIKAPLFVARQWMRHRTWSYNEISRRYTSDDISFYVPEKLRLQDETDRQSSDGFLQEPWATSIIHSMEHGFQQAYREYEVLLNNGVCREQARMVLPVSMYTVFYGTVNLHNLFHFLELRSSSHAQLEIREYAKAIEQIIEPIVPVSFKAWKELTK